MAWDLPETEYMAATVTLLFSLSLLHTGGVHI
jgi:hypothetical protein